MLLAVVLVVQTPCARCASSVALENPAATGTAAAAKRIETDLAALRERIRSEARRAESASVREKDLLRQVERLDRKIQRSRYDERRLRARIESLQRDVAWAEVLVKREDQRAGRLQVATVRRLRSAVGGAPGGITAVFGAASGPSGGEFRLSCLRRLIVAEAALFSRAREKARRASAKGIELAAKRRALEQAQGGLKRRLDEATSQRAAKDSLLRRARAEARSSKQLLSELQGASASLQKLVTDMDRAGVLPAPGVAFASLKGRLAWPVRGKIRARFGPQMHPQFRTTIVNRGIEIACEGGTPVRSPAAGVAVFADWFRGYGQLVVVDHGGGSFTVYGHLAEIAVRVNAPLAPGEVIGRSGETGSLSGPGLYFEVRRGGAPEDPLRWLTR